MALFCYSVGTETGMGKTTYPTREFSDRELKVSSFLVRHRERLRTLFIAGFVLVDAALILGSLAGGIYFIATEDAFNRAMSTLTVQTIDWPQLRPLIQARPVAVEEVAAVPGGTRTDFIARVRNVNTTRWAPKLRYRFTWDGGETSWFETFLMPGQGKYLLALGVHTIAPEKVRLEAEASWERPPLQGTVLQLSLTDSILVSGERFTRDDLFREGKGVTQGVVFDVRNLGPFGYHTIGFVVAVKSGPLFTAVHYITALNVFANTTRTIEARFIDRAGFIGGGTIIVEIDVNLFDEDNIIL